MPRSALRRWLPSRRARAALLLGFVAATALTLFFPTAHVVVGVLTAATMERHGLPPREFPSWTALLLRELPVWYNWLLVSPALVWLSRRFPLRGARWPLHVAVHLAAAVPIIAAILAVVVAYQTTFAPQIIPLRLTFTDWYLMGLAQHLGSLLIVYASIIAGLHAMFYSEELQRRTVQAARLETRLTQAQLDVLKTQLQPHFLFNTLNTVVSLMHSNVPAAQHTVLLLSDLLRRSLRNAASHEVALADELEFLDEYAAIQKIRFAERLNVVYQIEPGTRELLVPRLLLQPLLENAIRHGLQPCEEPGTVVVRSAREGGRLVLEVVDDGVGLAPGFDVDAPGGGIGLRNTRARLAQLYGGDHHFSIEPAAPRGVRVRISIPARDAGEVVEETEGGR